MDEYFVRNIGLSLFPFCNSVCLFLFVVIHVIVQMNQVSPQQTDVIEHHYRVFEKLQKIKAETEEVCDICYLLLHFSKKALRVVKKLLQHSIHK